MLPGMSGAAVLAGRASTLDTQNVISGSSGSIPDRQRGYDNSPALGSINDGTSNLYSGAVITEIYHDETNSWLYLTITGTLANSGWTTMAANGTAFLRTSATFSQSGGFTTWKWTGVGNPMGGSGNPVTVDFT